MHASAKLSAGRISLQHATILCKEIKGKRLEKAKDFLKNLIEQKTSLKGKYYQKASKVILKLLESAEANAKEKNMELQKIFIKQAKADKGQRFLRIGRWKKGRRKAKSANIEIILEER